MRASIPLTILITLLSPGIGHACGTIEGWVEVYFDPSHPNQPEALYMIHCGPIQSQFYKGTAAEHQFLAEMIDHALAHGAADGRAYAIKSYFLFDRLLWLRDTDVHARIVGEIERQLGRPVMGVKGRLSTYAFEDPAHYISIVQRELDAIAQTGQCVSSGREGVSLEAGLRRLRAAEQRILSFLDTVGACSDASAPGASEQVIRVRSERLNLRQSPSTQSQILKTLLQGDLAQVLRTGSGWLRVRDGTCAVGWVAEYLVEDARSR